MTGAASTRDNRLSPYFDDGGFRPSSLQSLTVGQELGFDPAKVPPPRRSPGAALKKDPKCFYIEIFFDTITSSVRTGTRMYLFC